MAPFISMPPAQRFGHLLRTSEMAKRFRDAKARIHQDYYAGKQYLRLYNNPSGPSIVMNSDLRNGMILDFSSVAIDFAVANITGIQFEYEAIPASTAIGDVKSAQAAKAVLNDHAYRNRLPMNDIKVAYHLAVAGEVGKRASFDPGILGTIEVTPEEAEMFERMSGPPVGKPTRLGNGKIRMTYPIGGTREHLVDASLIFPDPGFTEWSDVTGFSVVDYMPVYAAQLEFPEHADKIKAESINSRRSGGSGYQSYAPAPDEMNSDTGDRFDQLFQMTRIVQRLEKNDYGTWDRQVRTGSNYDVVLVDRETFTLNPYVLYQSRPTHTLWSKSLYDGMRKPQYTINVLATEQLSYFVNQLKDVLFVPVGTDTTPITNDYAQIIAYDPTSGGVPHYKPMDGSVHNVIQTILSSYVDSLFQFGQVSSATRGDTKTRLAGRALEVLTENNSEPLMMIRTRIREGNKEMARVILQIAQENYGVNRVASLVGPYGAYMAERFNGADILAGTDVHITEADRSPKSYQERLDMAIRAHQHGLFNPEAAEIRSSIDQFAKNGSLQELQKLDEVFAERQACEEEEMIALGMVSFGPQRVRTNGDESMLQPPPLMNMKTGEPLLHPAQISSIHIASHMERMNDPDYPAQAKKMLFAHISETQAMVSADQQAQQEAYIKSRQEESLADAAGPIAQQAVAQMTKAESDSAKVQGNPTSGGKNSGRTRSRG